MERTQIFDLMGELKLYGSHQFRIILWPAVNVHGHRALASQRQRHRFGRLRFSRLSSRNA